MNEPAEPRRRLPLERPGPSRWESFHPGRLILGLVLAVFGVVWLLDASDVLDVDLDVVLPVALIVVGIALMASGAYGRTGGGLTGLGVVLTVVLVATTIVDVPFTGGVGDRIERPVALGDRSYELGVGKLTLDLTSLAYDPELGPLDATIEGSVGIGELLVLLPDRSQVPCVAVDAHAGIGEVVVYGESRSGLGPDYVTDDVCTGPPVIGLELSVGMGQVGVTRG